MVEYNALISKTLVAAVAATVKTAIAVFVKTPARSRVKTRLAADIGKTRALAVYEESLRLLRGTLQTVGQNNIAVHWAVAEEEAVSDNCWADFPTLWTGEGTLGQRLHQVYARLREDAERVLLIGADCPQLTGDTLIHAAQQQNIVIGPARDGGFYLFAAAQDITREQWLAPTYSAAETLDELLAALAPARPALLPMLTDIDDRESLAQCIQELEDAKEAQTLQKLLQSG